MLHTFYSKDHSHLKVYYLRFQGQTQSTGLPKLLPLELNALPLPAPRPNLFWWGPPKQYCLKGRFNRPGVPYFRHHQCPTRIPTPQTADALGSKLPDAPCLPNCIADLIHAFQGPWPKLIRPWDWGAGDKGSPKHLLFHLWSVTHSGTTFRPRTPAHSAAPAPGQSVPPVQPHPSPERLPSPRGR